MVCCVGVAGSAVVNSPEFRLKAEGSALLSCCRVTGGSSQGMIISGLHLKSFVVSWVTSSFLSPVNMRRDKMAQNMRTFPLIFLLIL